MYNESLHPRDEHGHWIYKEVKENLQRVKNKESKRYPKKILYRNTEIRRKLADLVKAHRRHIVNRNKIKEESTIYRKLAAEVAANKLYSNTMKRIGKQISQGSLREQGRKVLSIKLATQAALKKIRGLSH